MIVANSTEVFGNDNSSVTILSENNLKEYNNISKSQVAKLILNYAKSIY